MTVLVTGGSGVVGLHVLRCLAQGGHKAVGLSRGGRPPAASYVLRDLEDSRDVEDSVEFVAGDIMDREFVLGIAEQREVDGVIHTAALTGEAQARARPLEVLQTNVLGTASILEVARQLGVRRVVYTGSSSQYGRREDLKPITEDEMKVEGLYAESKRMAQQLGAQYKNLFGVDFLTCIVSSCYGPGTRYNEHRGLVGNTLIAHLCESAARGDKVTLDGGGDYPRGWTYAADTAHGIVLAYEKESPAYEVYNIASGENYRVAEVVRALETVVPDADITVGAGTWDDDPYQSANFRGPLDIGRARNDLGFTPAYDLAGGLGEFVAWFRYRQQAGLSS